MVVGRYRHLIDPPRLRNLRVRVPRRQRQCQPVDQPHQQARLLADLPQDGLLLRLVQLDMAAHDHFTPQPCMVDQAQPPPGWKAAEDKGAGSRVLHGHLNAPYRLDERSSGSAAGPQA